MEEIRTIKLISDSGQTVVISEDAKDYLLDQDGLDLGVVGSTHNMTQYIDLVGQHLDSTILSPRDINIIGWIIGKDLEEINKRKVKLNKTINPLYNIKLEINNYALNFVPDSSIQYSTEWAYNNAYLCKFQIQGTAPMPLFMLKDYSTFRTTVEKTSEFHFPFSIPKDKGVKFGYYPYESIRNMPNEGDVESGMIITLIAKDGDVKNPKVTNLTTGESIEFKIDLSLGEKLRVDTQLGQQTATLMQGSLYTNAMKYLTIESDIDMTLHLGFNRMVLSAEEGEDNLDINIEFSPRFLEVEGR